MTASEPSDSGGGGPGPRPPLRRRVLDHLIEGCQIIGFDWTYRYVNEAAARQGKRRREELLGRTMMAVYPGIESSPAGLAIRDCLEHRARRRLENEFRFPDGTVGFFELRVEPVPEGAFVLSLDVGDRRRDERRIALLNAMLRGIRDVNQLITREHDPERLIEEACRLLVAARGFDACSIVRTDGRRLRFAAAGRQELRIAGLRSLFAAEDLPGCVVHALETGEPELRTPPLGDCATCPANRGIEQHAAVALPIATDGRRFGALLVSMPPGFEVDDEELDLLREAAGDVAFALAGIETSADRDLLERQLQQAQKMEAVGRLAGGLAHDFNNLLSVILASAELAERAVGPAGPLDELAEIRRATESAASLTRQLLTIGRSQMLAPRVLDLNAVVGGVERMLRRLLGADVVISTRLAPALGRVRADAGQIEQVILNLAVNARDAMPGGGRLTIETADVELDADYVRRHPTVAAGPHVMLAISDTGHGMDTATQARIFEPFFTTKEQGRGTGLGLATVYGIVKQSGGDVWVYSEPGRGTTFRVYLPRVDAEPEPRHASPPAERRGGDETILVVEDQEPLRRLVTRMLESSGFKVLVAADGAAALAAAAAHDGPLHLVLSDLVLPAMSGRELVERLRAERPGLGALLMSGYTEDAVLRDGELGAGVRFLGKPFTTAGLVAAVREALDG